MVKLYDIGRLRFYAGLMIVTAAVMMLQIIETRIISVISWYYLAFFVISVAMFGLTAGAVWVYLHPKVFTPSYLSFHLAVSTLGFALATVASLLVQLTLATTLSPTFTGVVVWTEFALALAVPFFFSGIAISLALMRSPYPVGKVYGVDLLGAATGCLGVLLALNLTSGPAAVLWLAAALAGAALLFAVPCAAVAPAGRTTARGLFRRRRLVCAVLLLLAGTNELTGHGVHPLFVKDKAESQEQFDYEGWNSFSRIMITKNMVNKSPRLWGPSPHIPVYRVEQREMNIDGGAGTVMYHFGGDLEELAFLRYDITNLAYAIPGLKTGAVIGVGGGRDLLSARLLGVERVVGVEINPILIDLLTNGFADYTAIARVPGISFEVDEARSWFARADQTFEVIQMSLIDTWAATGAGAFTLSENGLYTIEAWRIFLDRLSPEGVFTVSRWYAPGEVNETGRMVSLAVATLLDLGVTEPQRHLFLASTDNIATLIVSRSPLSHDTLDALHGSATQHGFSVLISPNHRPSSPVLQGIVAVADRAGLNVATQDYYLDLTPPTDARPFFFNQLRFDRLFDEVTRRHSRRPGVMGGNLAATMTLAMLVMVSMGLVLATIVVPQLSNVRHVAYQLAIGGTAYFLLIGAGFMITEIALLQRMSVFLGHPVYALSIVLFSLILATGIGSFASERLQLDTAPRIRGWASLTAPYLVAWPAWIPRVLLFLDSAGLLARAAFCVLVLAPAGLLMGFGFPTGIRLVTRIDSRPTPWFLGINGAAGVLAAGLAVLMSLAFDIDQTLRVGGLCYLLLCAPALFLATQRTPIDDSPN